MGFQTYGFPNLITLAALQPASATNYFLHTIQYPVDWAIERVTHLRVNSYKRIELVQGV